MEIIKKPCILSVKSQQIWTHTSNDIIFWIDIDRENTERTEAIDTYRITASSSSQGRLVAPMTSTFSSPSAFTPSNSRRNSVLSRLLASFSPSRRSHRRESISSATNETSKWLTFFKTIPFQKGRNKPIKTIDGCKSLAQANNARTSFSPSPTWRKKKQIDG